MGRQINFMMTELDEADFFAWLHGMVETRVEAACPDWSSLVDNGRPSGPLPDGTFGWFLWRPGRDPQPSRSDLGRHCIETKSQAVEFTRTRLEEGVPHAGRLWIYTSDPRPDEFMKWYDKLATWIRKRCRRDRIGNYWSPDALERWPHEASKWFEDVRT
jgi:hypothetical protein